MMPADRLALVTGGSSFIASHLIPALAEEGWRVRAIARSPRPAGLPASVEYRRGDLVSDHRLDALLDEVSHVFHLAGGSSSYCTDDEMYQANVVATQRLVEVAATRPLERFLFVSTSAVYGEDKPLPLPVSEDVRPQPSRIYGRTKWQAERIIWARSSDAFPATVVRPVSVYGPGATKLVASTILDAAVERYAGLERLDVPAEQIELRLVHIDDVVGACLHLAQAPAAVGRAFNVAALYPTSHELGSAVAAAMKMEMKVCRGDGCGLTGEARAEVRERMMAAGMAGNILLTKNRLQFLARANRNNRLSTSALSEVGYSPRITDLHSSVEAAVSWYRAQRWII